MPPVLTMSSTNYDYDYDTVQPYFLDAEEEDFYPPPPSQLLPGPGADIWKKFELLQTPPSSPCRRPSPADYQLSAADHLEMVSDLLDEECHPSAGFLQSFIIQDCMWSSSFAAATKLEKVVSAQLAALQARRDSSTPSATSSTDGASDQKVCKSLAETEYLQDLNTAATAWIDPTVVFPYATPSDKQSSHETAMEVGSEVCLESPPLSSNDSESEEETDEDAEEEDEIDVVTVDRRRSSRRSNAAPLVLKRSHVNMHQHNYAAQQPSASTQQPSGKRPRAEPAQRHGGRRNCWGPRPDGEGDGKRRTHNELEKHRRSELKMSFLALRDEVPAVAHNDRAAKVVILKKATKFIQEVREDERRLLATKDELRKRSRELKHRLELLRNLH